MMHGSHLQLRGVFLCTRLEVLKMQIWVAAIIHITIYHGTLKSHSKCMVVSNIIPQKLRVLCIPYLESNYLSLIPQEDFNYMYHIFKFTEAYILRYKLYWPLTQLLAHTIKVKLVHFSFNHNSQRTAIHMSLPLTLLLILTQLGYALSKDKVCVLFFFYVTQFSTAYYFSFCGIRGFSSKNQCYSLLWELYCTQRNLCKIKVFNVAVETFITENQTE